MQSTFRTEVAVHLLDKSALTKDHNPISGLELRVTIDEGALAFASNIAAKRDAFWQTKLKYWLLACRTFLSHYHFGHISACDCKALQIGRAHV